MSAGDPSPWGARAKLFLEDALFRFDGEDVIPQLEAAVACLRIENGELPESEMDDRSSLPCTCPPGLAERGGYRGGCPVHDVWEDGQ